MHNPTKHRVPSDTALPPVAGPSTTRLLRLLTGWRAGLREFAVILLSVTTALAAQAWWQAREDRERELDYLQQLLADTRENQRQLDALIAYDSTAGYWAERAMAVFAGAAPAPPADSLAAWVHRTARSGELQPRVGTLRSLVGSGDLRLVRNDTLRSALADYLARFDSEIVRQRDIRLSTMQQIGGFARAFPFIRGVFVQGARRAPPDTRRLLGDPDAASTLFFWQAENVNALEGLRGLRETIAHVLHALEVEPGVVGATASRARQH